MKPTLPPGEPARVMKIGGTTIKIYAPEPVSEEERKARHEAIVRAVARCLRSQLLQQYPKVPTPASESSSSPVDG